MIATQAFKVSRNVDEILVVEDGKVTERGSHDELIAKDSKYKKSAESIQPG